MRNIYFALIAVFFVVNCNAQTIFGSYWNGTVEKSVKLDVATSTFSTVNTLNGIESLAQAVVAFDPANGRYFNLTASQIKIIDVQTGLVVDTIVNTNPCLYGMEYDASGDRLIGTRWNGTNWIFCSLDLATKVYTDVNTLSLFEGVVQGETAFDNFNNRYFTSTNSGILIINSQTGMVIDTIANSVHMKGIEYNSSTGELMGTHWTGNHEVFTTLNIATNVFSDHDTLWGVESIVQGESAFDIVNNKYFSKTNLGLMVVNATTGSVIDTIVCNPQIKGIKVISGIEPPVVTQAQISSGLQVYPNPASGEVFISSEVKEKESTIYITDLSGGKTYAVKNLGAPTKFNMEHLPSGCYMVRDENNNTKILVKP